MRAALYPKGLWEQAQKNEKIDESKLKGIKLEYTAVPSIAGCMAEMEATPELINDLKTFEGNSGVRNQRQRRGRRIPGAARWL